VSRSDKHELILQILVDLAFTIGSELSLPLLLRKTLQRFMYHTGFPVGFMLAGEAGQSEQDQTELVIDSTIGDFSWLSEQGKRRSFPTALFGDETQLIQDADLLARIATSRTMAAGLVLPIRGYGFMVLLSPSMPVQNLPLTTLFKPVLVRLGNAIILCQGYEQGMRRKLLRSVVETIPDLIWVKDPNGVYLACNPRFERLYGSTADKIVGKSDADFVDRELAAFFRKNDLAAIEADGPSINEEWLTFAADGYRGLFETVKSPMRDADGNLVGVLGVAREITQRKQAEEQLRLAASVFSEAGEGIIITDPQGVIVEANQSFLTMSGYERDEVIGKTPSILKSDRQAGDFYADLWETLFHNGNWRGELWNRRKNGEQFATRLAISGVRDPDGKVAHYVAMLSDITDQKQQQDHIQTLVYYDALTRLPNRALLADRMWQAISASERQGTQVVVCYLDLDNFKPINDRYGHPVGDTLLVDVSKRLTESIRPQDTASRLGGDEFVLLLTEVKGGEEYVSVLDRVNEALGMPYIVAGNPTRLSVSMGVTTYPADDSDPDLLLRHADQAMYLAKQSGRDQIHYYDPLQDMALRERQETKAKIRTGLLENQFQLYWQPIVNLQECGVASVEALIRWLPPDGRIVPPKDFLPQIEDDDLMVELGDWILQTAVAQLSAWRAQGIDLIGNINIAARQLQSTGFLDGLQAVLSRYPDVSPGQVELEILETTALEDMARVNDLIGRCRAMGIRFALDDFGTGYSSMTYLRRLAVDTVKIDQSFVRGMLDDANDLAIVEGIMGMASAFRRRTVAEGVESIKHGILLQKLGCQMAQGYAIARPMPAERLAEWIRSYKPHAAWQGVSSKA
jgi:diguanylate cyclase (GGDEF)-like protein/PAS domain S-box-containing protein